MTIIEILNYSKKVIENVTLAAVNKITGHKYDVKFPEIQKVNGKVEISNFPKNQKVLVEFPQTQKVVGKVETDTKPFFSSIYKKLDEVKTVLADKNIKVVNFPAFPKFPDSIKISNLKDEKELDFSGLETKLDSVIKTLKQLPKELPQPKDIVFPKTKEIVFPKEFSISNLEELKSDKPTEYVPVRLTDGKEFYKAIEEFYQQVASQVTFTDIDGKKTPALVDSDRHLQVDVLSLKEENPDYEYAVTGTICTMKKIENGITLQKVIDWSGVPIIESKWVKI